MSNRLLPGSTIGILGGGQLGRMLSLVAKRLGYTTVVFTEREDSPAGQVSDHCILGDLSDQKALKELGVIADVITYETENIPIDSCRYLQQFAPVRPDPDAIYHTQHRARERQLLNSLGIPVAPYHLIKEPGDVATLPADFVFPAILKTASFGYDGRGQVQVASSEQLKSSWQSLGSVECILEEKISFIKEFSVIIVGSAAEKELLHYGPIENHHSRHILDISTYPAEIPEDSARQALEYTTSIGKSFKLEGVVTVEFFLTANGSVMVNEIAPRPHNSGHLTIEGFATSQFEQQLRGICGLPLGSNQALCAAAMVNLLGELWRDDAEPHFEKAFSQSNTFLHLYGKQEARPKRKMGHITVTEQELSRAREKALALRASLTDSES